MTLSLSDLFSRRGVCGPNDPEVDQAESEGISNRVCALLAERKFDELDALAKELRTSKAVFFWGEWKLESYYDGLSSDPKTFDMDDSKACLAVLEQWKNVRPQSAAARMFLAKAHHHYGWKARGTGWARDVTPEGWRALRYHLDLAWKALKEAEELEPNDPIVYQVQVNVGNGMSLSRKEMDAIVEKGMKIQPPNPQLFTARAYSLLPRWGGRPGELEAFAARVADATRDTFGDWMYAYVAYSVRGYAEPNVIEEFGFKWPRLKSGFQQWSERVPKRYDVVQYTCRLACELEDRETAAALFRKDNIGEKAFPEIWTGQKTFEAWKAWALENAPCPESPLFKALKKADLDEVKKAMESGGDVNALDPDGRAMIFVAIETKNPAIVEFLLMNKADAQAVDPTTKYKPLLLAVWSGSLPLVEVFLKYGASPLDDDKDGWCAFHYAVIAERIDMVEAMLRTEGGHINLATPYGKNALHVSAKQGSRKMVEYLLKKGIDTVRYDAYRVTPYYRATQNNHPELADLIKEHQDKVYEETRQRFLQKGDLNQETSDHKNPLLVAVEMKDHDFLKILLDHGADPNKPAPTGALPLHTAIQHADEPAAEILLKKGADPYLFQAGETAMHCAVRERFHTLIQCLQRHGKAKMLAEPYRQLTPLHYAIQYAEPSVLATLVEIPKIDLNPRDHQKRTPLFLAVHRNLPEHADLLLKAGANPTIPDDKGKTPLDIAREKNNAELIARLENAGKKK